MSSSYRGEPLCCGYDYGNDNNDGGENDDDDYDDDDNDDNDYEDNDADF